MGNKVKIFSQDGLFWAVSTLGGNSGHFKKGHDFLKGAVVSAEGGCQKIQKCRASEQLSLKLETNSPAQHGSLPLPCSPKLCVFFFFSFKVPFSFRRIQAVLARLDQITARQVRWLL